MKKLLTGLLTTGLILGMSACGNSDNSGDTTNTEIITDTSTPSAPTVQGSSYFNKIGENGTVLDAGARSWDMVEFVDEGLLINNPSFVNSLKTYKYSEAEDYCSNLSSAGYSDFRLPTSDELELLLKIMILSQTERNYFENYFADIRVKWVSKSGNYTDYYSIWSTTEADNNRHYGSYISDYPTGYKTTAGILYNDSAAIKAFCVRKW